MKKAFLKFWVTDKLPKEHIKVLAGSSLKLYLYRWVVHPIKRRVAKYYLILLRKFFGLKVIGITGSAGKTTTKEMLASILKLNGKTVYTVANIDPVYNIPSAILKCSTNTKYLVLEMGVEYPGEMDFYLWLAKLDVGVITNVSYTHTLFFGSLEGVFKEKSKLVKNLSKNSWAILNRDDKKLISLEGKLDAHIMWCGNGGFIQAEDVTLSSNSETSFSLIFGNNKLKAKIPVVGRHFVDNALSASAAAFVLGVKEEKIVEGLKASHIEAHRMNVFFHKSGALVVDDSYNNNPSAAYKTLETFFEIAGKRKKLVVMGDMLELGKLEKSEHIKLGRKITEMGADYVMGVGEASKYLIQEVEEKKSLWLKDNKDVVNKLKPFLNRDWAILIKGSRSIGLDKVVDHLLSLI